MRRLAVPIALAFLAACAHVRFDVPGAADEAAYAAAHDDDSDPEAGSSAGFVRAFVVDPPRRRPGRRRPRACAASCPLRVRIRVRGGEKLCVPGAACAVLSIPHAPERRARHSAPTTRVDADPRRGSAEPEDLARRFSALGTSVA